MQPGVRMTLARLIDGLGGPALLQAVSGAKAKRPYSRCNACVARTRATAFAGVIPSYRTSAA
jgi:hypothetical protein